MDKPGILNAICNFFPWENLALNKKEKLTNEFRNIVRLETDFIKLPHLTASV